tara:strand:- start:842 stop:1204 length:363 start_codon:yes stop_codon:yes gene_type:complete
MALIVGGTTVTGSTSLTSSTLSGALPEIDGSALTNLPGPDSGQVGTGVGQIGYDGVGSTGLFKLSQRAKSRGQTESGAFLTPTSAGNSNNGIPLNGTWICMGVAQNSNQNTQTTVWTRQS